MKKAFISFFAVVFIWVFIQCPLSKADEWQNPFISGLEGYTLIPLPEISELDYWLNDEEGRTRMAYGVISEYLPYAYSGCTCDDLVDFIPVDPNDARMEIMHAYRGSCFCASFRHRYCDDVSFTVFISFSNRAALFSEFSDMRERIDRVHNVNIDAGAAVNIAEEHSGITDTGDNCHIRANLVFVEGKCLWHICFYQKMGPFSMDVSAEVNQFADYLIDALNGEILDFEILQPTTYDIFIEQSAQQ